MDAIENELRIYGFLATLNGKPAGANYTLKIGHVRCFFKIVLRCQPEE
jgi:hypothetical protein